MKDASTLQRQMQDLWVWMSEHLGRLVAEFVVEAREDQKHDPGELAVEFTDR